MSFLHAGSLEVTLTVSLNNDAWFLTDLDGVPIHPDSVAFIFGAVLMVSGIIFYKYFSFLQNYCCKKCYYCCYLHRFLANITDP